MITRCNEAAQNIYGTSIGFSIRDNEHPEMSPSRPGYVYILEDDLYPAPAAPWFADGFPRVQDGLIQVRLLCSEAVDGFQISISDSSEGPDTTHVMTDLTGWFEFFYPTSCYIYARTYRGPKYSVWVAAGELSPDQEEFTSVWEDNALIGGAYQPYPNLHACINMIPYYYNWSGINHVCFGTNWSAGISMSFFQNEDITATQYGLKVETCIQLNQTAGHKTGILFGVTDGVFTADWELETGYALVLDYAGINDYRAYLYTFTGTVFTKIAESANCFPGWSDRLAIPTIFKREGNLFTVYINEVKVLNVQDDTIPASEERKYIGLTGDGDYSSNNYTNINHYLRIYKRNAGTDPIEIDPGNSYADLLEGGHEGVPIILGEHIRFATGEDAAPTCQFTMDADGRPEVNIYDAQGDTLQETISLDPISGYSGYSGAGLSGYSGYSGAGLSGYSGYSGAGSSGYSGYSGAGLSGYSGYSGFSGDNPGSSGYSGYSGFSGDNPGSSGYSGYSGSGVSGYSGSGVSGYSGSGVSGYSGYSGASTILADYHITTTDAFNISIDGNTLKFLEIEWLGKFTNNSTDGLLVVRPNNDSGSNYNYMTKYYENGGSDQQNTDLSKTRFTVIAGYGASTYAQENHSICNFGLESGQRRFCRAIYQGYTSASKHFFVEKLQYWTNTADNITSLYFSWEGSPTSIDGRLVIRKKG